MEIIEYYMIILCKIVLHSYSGNCIEIKNQIANRL